MRTKQSHVLDGMVERLERSAGASLRAVVLYGAAARGDYYEANSDINLLIVVEDLELATLRSLGAPLRWWLGKRLPMPRIFSPRLIAEAEDVFPIEFLDIAAHHRILYGEDPFAGLEVHTDHLRLQCERELREKMMRLREAYIAAHGRTRPMRRLLGESYTTFVNIFRGCLRLVADRTPARDAEVVDAFCEQAGIDAAPFHQVERLKHDQEIETPLDDLFEQYYSQLTRAVSSVDRFGSSPATETTRETQKDAP